MRVYHADSRDLRISIPQIITPIDHNSFLAALGYPIHEALANVIADNSAREEAVPTALANTLQQPYVLGRIVEIKPKNGEGADEILERFSELNLDQSGDLNYRNGANSPCTLR